MEIMQFNSWAMHVLVAPIGESPAVVTEVRDELAREGIPVNKVVVLYTKLVKPYFTMLQLDFAYGEYRGRVELVGIPLPLDDVSSREDCLVFRRILLSTVRSEMRLGTVHLLISGGRKSMVVDSVLVALALKLPYVYHVKFPEGALRGRSLPKVYDLESYLITGPPPHIMRQISEICHPRIRDVILIKIPLPKIDDLIACSEQL